MKERIERLTEGNSEAEGVVHELYEEYGVKALEYLSELNWGGEVIAAVYHEIAGEDLAKMYAVICDAFAEEDLS